MSCAAPGLVWRNHHDSVVMVDISADFSTDWMLDASSAGRRYRHFHFALRVRTAELSQHARDSGLVIFSKP